MTTRRTFLQNAGVISLAPMLPKFVHRDLHGAENGDAEEKDNGRILVVIQLDGGNDGLNTVVPYGDELYAKYRRALRIEPEKVLKIDSQVGLHPSMRGTMDLFEDQRLTIVQGVGYPNPNRSHFESMAIWHHASLESNHHDGNGWLGRAFDQVSHNGSSPHAVSVGHSSIPAAIQGRRSKVVGLTDFRDLKLHSKVESLTVANESDDLNAFVARTVHQSYEVAKQWEDHVAQDQGTAYPSTKLARDLKLAARMIKLGSKSRVYYALQPGYDTHAGQTIPHSQLLSELSGALKAFLDDMQLAKLDDRVIVMAFSEFGRRVQENGSSGTDHGAAGPVFLAGKHVAGGCFGDHPSLSDLDDGDLKMSIDFRQLYATILNEWLGIGLEQTLSKSFSALPIISSIT